LSFTSSYHHQQAGAVLSFRYAGRSFFHLFMSSKRSSGLDFSDGQDPMLQLQQHPDLAIPYDTGLQPGHLRRNKTERRRLQGLQRSNTVGSAAPPDFTKAKTFQQRFKVWMINEGGRRLFFGVWVVLHLLVAIFGFFNYQLKDNNVTARATFGVTYGPCTPPF
jgi:hypothetical protein